MKKDNVMKIHLTTSVLALLIIFTSIIKSSLSWPSLPDNIGVHFAGDGSFDVFVDKNNLIFILYPYIISLIVIILCGILIYALGKVKVSPKISKVQELKIKTAIAIQVDVFFKMIWIYFLSVVWPSCIIKQQFLNTEIPILLFNIYVFSLVILILYIFMVKHEKEEDNHQEKNKLKNMKKK